MRRPDPETPSVPVAVAVAVPVPAVSAQLIETATLKAKQRSGQTEESLLTQVIISILRNLSNGIFLARRVGRVLKSS